MPRFQWVLISFEFIFPIELNKEWVFLGVSLMLTISKLSYKLFTKRVWNLECTFLASFIVSLGKIILYKERYSYFFSISELESFDMSENSVNEFS